MANPDSGPLRSAPLSSRINQPYGQTIGLGAFFHDIVDKTARVLLIFGKNTLIFAVFAALDKLLIWWLNILLSSPSMYVRNLLEGMEIFSVFIISLAYLVHLLVELYVHRSELFGEHPSKKHARGRN